MNKKVLILTTIKPDPLNRGGNPSGLIWEIIESLKKDNINIDVFLEKESMNKIPKILNKYGIYLEKIKIDFSVYEKIIVYPENLVLKVPKFFRKKIIVVGPDSPSLRDARLYKEIKKNGTGILKKCIIGIYYIMAKYHEYRVLKQVKSFLVVGKTDKFWMKKNPYIRNKLYLKEKIKFLRHPILSKVVKNKLEKENISKKRFIFSGDLNYLFNRRFIINVGKELKALNNVLVDGSLEIIVVGKNNKWMVDLFLEIKICRVKYIDWIEDYNNICIMGQDIHCLPLLVGAGTKNRTLTAIANGLEVITTPIGIENIAYKNLTSVYITNNAKCFVEYMMYLNNKIFSSSELELLKKERLNFRSKVKKEYEKCIEKYIVDEI